MTNLEKYDKLFFDAFKVKAVELPSLKYQGIALAPFEVPGRPQGDGSRLSASPWAVGEGTRCDPISFGTAGGVLGEGGYGAVIDPNDPKGPLERLEELGWEVEWILLTHAHMRKREPDGSL